MGRDDTISAQVWLNDWGLTLFQLGRPLEAEVPLRRALELQQGPNGGGASPMMLTNYAQMMYELARLDDAASYAERAYQGGTQSKNQIVLNQTRLRLARIYRARHDLDRATRMLDEAEPSMRTLLPAGHFAFGSLAAERALLARERGDFPGALGFIDRAIEIDTQAEKGGKSGAQYLPILLTHRATIEFAAGEVSAAESDIRRALGMFDDESWPGDYSSYTGGAYLTLARVLMAEGKEGEARAAAQAAEKQLEKAVGAGHPDTLAAKALGGWPATPAT
jgi:tetratricopeptide (TPR) repeat protein